MNTNELSAEELDVYELLREVIDPELMVNIIDLGLVYGIQLSLKTNRILINLTLTSPGCPMGDAIIQDIEQTVIRTYQGFEAEVQLVWSPVWSLDMVSEEGKIALSEL